MDYITPLSTFFRHNPDYSPSDAHAEFLLLQERQSAIDDLLDGKISTDDLLDLLDSQDIDPIEYAIAATRSLNYVIDSGIEVEGW